MDMKKVIVSAVSVAIVTSGLFSGPLVAEDLNGALWKGNEVEVTVLMEYVSKVLDKRFLYDPGQLRGRKIAVLSTSRIPRKSVYRIFHSIMRMNGFILVEYEDYVRVEQAANAGQVQTGVFKDDEAAGLADEDRVITRIFQLEYANANSISAALKQLLGRQAEQAIPLAESNTLVVTGYARNLERVASVIEACDRKVLETASECVELRHASANAVAQQLQPMLKGFTAERLQKGTSAIREPSAAVIAVPRTNAMLLSGTEEERSQLKQLIAELDVAGVETTTEYLQLEHAEASALVRHLEPLAKAFAAERARPGPKQGLPPMDFSADPRTNGLVVTGTPDEIQSARGLIARLDVAVPMLESSVRVFRVQNADAEDLVNALKSVLAAGVPALGSAGTRPDGKAGAAPGRTAGDLEIVAQGGSILVRAPVATLDRVAALLKELDVRKPKVLIEAAILELTVSKDFDLGVELATVDRPTRDPRPFGATSVGISRLLDSNNDGIPDARVPLTGAGVIAGVFKNTYGDIPLLIRALEQKAGLRILAAPMVIADDNEEATFTASDQYPVATFSTTASTTDVTSFGGFQEAKIQLKIRPNINEEEGYLRLEIEQVVESFQGDPVSPNLPPRKISREVKAVLTVPDGRTVAVGGLSSNRTERSQRGVPILQHIPLLGMAFRGRTKGDLQTRLYVFVNPTILKDESFEDYERISAERKRKMDELFKAHEEEDQKSWKWRGRKRKSRETEATDKPAPAGDVPDGATRDKAGPEPSVPPVEK